MPKPESNTSKRELSTIERRKLLNVLKTRFEKNMNRHKGLEWIKVQAKFEVNSEKLLSLNRMERTGGEPDVVGFDEKSGEFVFYDCSVENPEDRRKVCYDHEGQVVADKRGSHPAGNAVDIAAAMGIELLTEEQYRELQRLGDFDLKTSSWLKTPSDIRRLGGAIFAECRYEHVFVFHNSASSWYSARGFRGSLRV